MNEHEAGRVLLIAISLDPKMPQPDEAGLIRKVWAKALHDVPIEAAQNAVIAHYRSDEYAQRRETIAPADIVQWWNARRRPTAAEKTGENAATMRALPPVAFDPQRFRHGMDQVQAVLEGRKLRRSDTPPDDVDDIAEGEAVVRRELRSRPCSHCGARVGQPCVDHRGKALTRSTAHPARVDAVVVETPRGAREDALAEVERFTHPDVS